MKRLFYLSASILMLALAFHFGYTTARLPRALLWAPLALRAIRGAGHRCG